MREARESDIRGSCFGPRSGFVVLPGIFGGTGRSEALVPGWQDVDQVWQYHVGNGLDCQLVAGSLPLPGHVLPGRGGVATETVHEVGKRAR